jgi:hypothetical protein
VNGEGRDAGRSDDAPDRQCGAELARVSLAQPIAEAMGKLAKLPSEPLY